MFWCLKHSTRAFRAVFLCPVSLCAPSSGPDTRSGGEEISPGDFQVRPPGTPDTPLPFFPMSVEATPLEMPAERVPLAIK